MSGSGLVFLVSIPVWGQFVALMKHALEFLASTTGSPGLAIIIFTVLVSTSYNFRRLCKGRLKRLDCSRCNFNFIGSRAHICKQ